jgi:signal recognition particle subunit SRP54
MLPGTKGQISEEDIDESVLTRTAAVIQSMTPAERDDPKLLNASRKKRIAAGSGTTVQQVNQVLKQFELMQAMTRQISGGKLPKGIRNLMGGSASGIPGLAGMGSGGGGGHSKGRTKPSKKRKKKR